MIRLYHTTTEVNAHQILRDQRFEDAREDFRGRTGVWLATEPIDAQDQKVSGWTYLIVDVDLPPADLEPYDSGRYVEEIDGYRTLHIPSRLLDGKVVVTMGGDVHELPSILDDMSDSEREAYLRTGGRGRHGG
jgi:hypothetical protein